MMTIDNNRNKLFFRANGKDLLRREDNEGNTIHYNRSGTKKLYKEDGSGNKVYYRDDGETEWFRETPNGDRTYLKDDGKTPDYSIIGGKRITYKAPNAPTRPRRLRSRLSWKRLTERTY